MKKTTKIKSNNECSEKRIVIRYIKTPEQEAVVEKMVNSDAYKQVSCAASLYSDNLLIQAIDSSGRFENYEIKTCGTRISTLNTF